MQFRILERKISDNETVFEIQKKDAGWFKSWEYVTTCALFERAEALVKSMAHYPHTVNITEYDSKGRKILDCPW